MDISRLAQGVGFVKPAPRAAVRVWVRCTALALAVLAFLVAVPAHAAPAFPIGNAPAVTVSMISSPSLTLDSNKPCTEGPRAAYVAFRVTNGSGATQPNLRATIAGFANGITLGGGQAAAQWVGTLAPGATRVLYWFVAYPCTFGNAATLTVSVTNGTAGAATGSGTVTTASMVSAQAGGVLVSGLLGPGAVVGQIIEFDVEFGFGGVSAGDSYNLQVAGNQNFRADCFQLVRQAIIQSGVTAAPVGEADRPFFAASDKQTGGGHPLTVRFFFKYLCAGVTSTSRPYGNQFSGGQLKYSSNYETFVGPSLSGATNPFDVSKSASPAQLPAAGPVTYTVSIHNPAGSFATQVDSIVDELPAGVAYVGMAAGGVTPANSGSVPAAGAMGRLVWRSNPGSSWTVNPGTTLTLVYTAQVNKAGRFVNSAWGYAGTTPLDTGGVARATVVVGTANVSIVKTGPAQVVVGDTAVYVLTTHNAGPDTAYDVVVRDVLPAGATFVSASRATTASAGQVTFAALPTLASGASRVDTVRVAAPLSVGTLTNVGAATSATFDDAPADNDGTAPASRAQSQVVGPVVVTPDGLPSPTARLRGTGYPQPYVVNHRGGASATYDVVLRRAGASLVVSVDSITGPGISGPAPKDSVRLTLAPRTTTTYTVWYTVPAGDTAQNVETLLARSVADVALRDSGWAEIRRAAPTLTLTKSVSPGGVVSPGTDLTYEMRVANVGDYEAAGVRVSDQVADSTDFKVGSPRQTLPGALAAAVAYDAGDGAWAYTPQSGGCGAPAGYDRCVKSVRWSLSGPLPPGAESSLLTVRFTARIR